MQDKQIIGLSTEYETFDEVDIGTEIIVKMANTPNEREKLVSVLAKNGVSVDINAPNEEIYTAIFTAIATSRSFRNDLKKAVFSYLKENNEEFSNWSGARNLFDQQTGQLKLTPELKTKLDKQNRKKDRGDGFFSGLFTKENAATLSNFAINLLSNKLTAKADASQVQDGIKYQVAKANASEQKEKEEAARKKWIVPVVVVSGIVLVTIVGYLIYRYNKSPKK